MTRITVVPLDARAPGSYAEFVRVYDLLDRLRQAAGRPEEARLGQIYVELEKIIRAHVEVEGGTWEEVREELSFDEFHRILLQLLGRKVAGQGEEGGALGEASGGTSRSGRPGTGRRRRGS